MKHYCAKPLVHLQASYCTCQSVVQGTAELEPVPMHEHVCVRICMQLRNNYCNVTMAT